MPLIIVIISVSPVRGLPITCCQTLPLSLEHQLLVQVTRGVGFQHTAAERVELLLHKLCLCAAFLPLHLHKSLAALEVSVNLRQIALPAVCNAPHELAWIPLGLLVVGFFGWRFSFLFDFVSVLVELLGLGSFLNELDLLKPLVDFITVSLFVALADKGKNGADLANLRFNLEKLVHWSAVLHEFVQQAVHQNELLRGSVFLQSLVNNCIHKSLGQVPNVAVCCARETAHMSAEERLHVFPELSVLINLFVHQLRN